MNLVESVQSVLSKYAEFSGRASRSEFWWWYLVCTIYQIVAFLIVIYLVTWIGGVEGYSEALGNIVMIIVSLPILIPTLAVSVRLLHDINRSVWWYLLILVPLIGPIVLIIWFIKRGTEAPNDYGQPVIGPAT